MRPAYDHWSAGNITKFNEWAVKDHKYSNST
jgi:hypothetical protein